VIDNGALVGVVSERDYARQIILKGKSSRETQVRDIMTADLVTTAPDQETADCMALMTDKRIRHLPVLENGKLVGMLSIGDLVRSIIAEQQTTINDLAKYISG